VTNNLNKKYFIKAPLNKLGGAFIFGLTQRCLTLIMIKKLLYTALITGMLFSCSDAVKKDPVTDTDVATTFIRAVLDNDFKTAEKYLLTDEVNKQYFETFIHQYQQKNKAELDKYKSADIIIDEIKPESDSVHLVDYTNTYKKMEKNKLKLVWVSGKWLIDFKYTFAENK
jgi:hypothetical protein